MSERKVPELEMHHLRGQLADRFTEIVGKVDTFPQIRRIRNLGNELPDMLDLLTGDEVNVPASY